MASWLDAFVQGREQGFRTSLGGLEAGASARRGFETEMGTRRRSFQDATLTSADMALRRNIAQSELDYKSQVDRATYENQREQLRIDAARLAAEQEANRNAAALQNAQLRLTQQNLADAESLRNFQSVLLDPNVDAMGIIQAAGLIPYQDREQLKPSIREALFRRLGGNVLTRSPRGAYQFAEDVYRDSPFMMGNTPVSARELKSYLRDYGLETETLFPGTETGTGSNLVYGADYPPM